MLSLPFIVSLVGLTVWGFFSPVRAGYFFIALATVFTLWQLLAARALRRYDPGVMQEPYFFTAEELRVFQLHAMYFLYLQSARGYSSTFTMMQITAIVWVCLQLFNGNWVLAGAAAVVALVATNMAPYINPGNFLRYHHARGKLPAHLEEKLLVVEAIEQKLTEHVLSKFSK